MAASMADYLVVLMAASTAETMVDQKVARMVAQKDVPMVDLMAYLMVDSMVYRMADLKVFHLVDSTVCHLVVQMDVRMADWKACQMAVQMVLLWERSIQSLLRAN